MSACVRASLCMWKHFACMCGEERCARVCVSSNSVHMVLSALAFWGSCKLSSPHLVLFLLIGHCSRGLVLGAHPSGRESSRCCPSVPPGYRTPSPMPFVAFPCPHSCVFHPLAGTFFFMVSGDASHDLGHPCPSSSGNSTPVRPSTMGRITSLSHMASHYVRLSCHGCSTPLTGE